MQDDIQEQSGVAVDLKALCQNGAWVVWKSDHPNSDLEHLSKIVRDLSERDLGIWVLASQSAGNGVIQDESGARDVSVLVGSDPATAVQEHLMGCSTSNLAKSGRGRGRKGGRKFALTKEQVCRAQTAMTKRETSVTALAEELGVRPVTLYRYVGPTGELRAHGRKVLEGTET